MDKKDKETITDCYGKVIMLNGNKEIDEEIIHMVNQQTIRKTSVHMMYKPSCGCEYEKPVLLDRFPMSEKIICGKCSDCLKFITLDLIRPYIFYVPMTEIRITHEELRTHLITPGRQEAFLKAYQELKE